MCPNWPTVRSTLSADTHLGLLQEAIHCITRTVFAQCFWVGTCIKLFSSTQRSWVAQKHCGKEMSHQTAWCVATATVALASHSELTVSLGENHSVKAITHGHILLHRCIVIYTDFVMVYFLYNPALKSHLKVTFRFVTMSKWHEYL